MAPEPELVIRHATTDDFETWFELYDAVAGEGRWIGGEQPVDRGRRREVFERYIASDDATTLIAEIDGRVIGNLGNLGIEVSRGIAEIGMMVEASWRGRGVGSKLMESCIAWVTEHGAHKITLTLWPHNAAALALYRKFGFVEEATLHRHYRRHNGQLWDAIGMGLVLDWGSPGGPEAP